MQLKAEVNYLVRSPKSSQVVELFERVKDVARGSALMTGTKTSFHIEGGASNLIPNVALERTMHDFMAELEPPAFTDEEMDFAKAIYDGVPEADKRNAAMYYGKEVDAVLSHPIFC